MKDKRCTIAAAAAVFFAIAIFPLSAGGGSEAPAKPRTVKIAALKGPTGLGMIRLFQDKPVLAENVSAEYAAYAGPDTLLPKLLTGETDIAAIPANLAANLYNKKIPYRLVAVIGTGMLSLVTTDPAIKSLEDLKGREVQNTAKGSTPEFIFRHILEKKGLDKDVRVSFKYGHIELAQTLIAGRETIGVLPEPFVTKVLLANKSARIAVDLQKEWETLHPEAPVYPMTALVAREALLRDRPDVLDKFIAAYKVSQDWVKANPKAAGAAAEKLSFGISESEAEEAVPRCRLVYIPAAEAKTLLGAEFSVFMKFAPEAIGGKIPDADFYVVR